MKPKLERRLLDISKRLIDIPNGKNKHFSFIIYKNKILSIGFNDYFTTHTKCKELGYRFDAMHSELSAVLKFRGSKKTLGQCVLVNTRINSFGQIGMSKPCHCCIRLIEQIGFKRVWYTNADGKFYQLEYD